MLFHRGAVVTDDGMISVAVCTWNGGHLLPDCLAALESQSLDPGQFEVLIVDNNSTDDTAQIAREWVARSLLDARYILESNPGLSSARNRAVEEAAGEAVVFIDDDSRPHTGFLAGMQKAFRETGADLVGGRIIPVLPSGCPGDVPESYLKRIRSGGLNLGVQRRPMLPTEYVVGANMAFTKSLVARLGRFDCELGYVGHKKIAGEDTDLCVRAHRAGALVVYEPDAVVDHVIAEDRLTKKHMIQAAFGYGVGRARLLLSGGRSIPARILDVLKLCGEIVLYGIGFVLTSWSGCCRLRCRLMISKCSGKLSVLTGLQRHG